MSNTKTSKFLSLVLRHQPSAANVTLDAGGWVDVEALLAGASAAGVEISRAELESVVAGSDKRRFVIRDGKIRANQGHSVPVDLGLERLDPPATLYHGTARRNLAAILAEGLSKRERHHVHLSADRETARRVGARHGEPVVLSVDAASMSADGVPFFRSENGVWLVERVPPTYLSA